MVQFSFISPKLFWEQAKQVPAQKSSLLERQNTHDCWWLWQGIAEPDWLLLFLQGHCEGLWLVTTAVRQCKGLVVTTPPSQLGGWRSRGPSLSVHPPAPLPFLSCLPLQAGDVLQPVSSPWGVGWQQSLLRSLCKFWPQHLETVY